MPAPFLIIDGYNLLHAAGLSQARYAPGDLQRQRHRLLVRLVDQLKAEERVRCTVVFDAMEAPSGLERKSRHAEINIHFAEPGHDADSLIEALIEAHSAPSQLLVVSSDHRLQKAARQRRADSVDSEIFLQRLAARVKAATAAKPTSEAGSATNPKTSGSSDVAYWMSEFGDIDVAAIAKSDDPDANLSAVDPWQKNLDDLQKQLEQDADLDNWLNRPPKGKAW